MSAMHPRRQLCALLLPLLLLVCALQLGSAQVTFSKGWGPGKRAAVLGDQPECRLNAKSLGLLFSSLMAELKRSLACDHRAAVNYLQAAVGEHYRRARAELVPRQSLAQD